jgi:UDP-N-acetylmuramate--alanine ligase
MRLKWSIAVGGTHGKTTTTSMIAALLDAAGLDPTVINGGIINAYGTNARLGAGEWMVVEADESDGTFVRLPATIAVVTNIDPEHMEFYGDFDALRAAFQSFVENIPFYGFAALCIDHAEVQAMIGRVPDRRIVTYGSSPQADIRATDMQAVPEGMRFDVAINRRGDGGIRVLQNLVLRMPGAHNVQNALAMIAIATEMGTGEDIIRAALSNFEGVRRRFTRVGTAAGISVVDDYAHHPVEIAAVLDAAREVAEGRVIAVVQPHRYTRLRDLFEEFCSCFNDADAVVVADVFAAGEAAIEGYDRDSLADGLRARGHRAVVTLEDEARLAETIASIARAGDLVICLGAGSISQWANELPARLIALSAPPHAVGGGQ